MSISNQPITFNRARHLILITLIDWLIPVIPVLESAKTVERQSSFMTLKVALAMHYQHLSVENNKRFRERGN